MNTLHSHIRHILTILYILMFSINAHAFFNDDFHLLTIQDGLADNKVNCIFKDTDGFMWFGTDFGISLYNGSSFKNFTIPGSNNRIHSIYQLNTEYLGVLTEDNKLYAFNLQQEEFLSIQGIESYASIIGLYPMTDGSCWILTDTFLLHGEIQIQTGSNGKTDKLFFKAISGKNLRQITSGAITCYAFYPNQSYLYLTDNTSHLIRYHLKTETVEKSIFIPRLPKRVPQILKQDKYVWISTVSEGLIRYNEQTGQLDYFNYNSPNPSHRISHTDIYGIVPLSHQQLLLPTWNGYTLLTSKDNTFDNPHIQIYNNTSLTNQHIEPRMICAYYDPNGILWIGTYGGGILFSNLRQQLIRQFRQNRHNEITGMTFDKKGYLWMTTYHKGVMKSKNPFNPTSDLNFDYLDSSPEGKHTTALCIYQDTLHQEMWIGRQDGQITIYSAHTNQHKTIKLFPEGTENQAAIWCILQDRHNNFWIGTDHSLLYYTHHNKQCRRIHVSNNPSKSLVVRTLAKDRNGTIWLGTEYNGLGKVSKGEIILGYGEAFKLQHTSIRSLLVTDDEELYIGSTTGLYIMNLKNENITDAFSTRNGLINNMIGCLLQDSNRHIWIGSNSCISRYSRKQKLFYHYFLSGSNSSVCAYNQYQLWGNNRNLTYFNPEEISNSERKDPVAIHTLEINSKIVDIGEQINGQTILSKNLYHTHAITLSNANRNFSLGFNSLSYNNQPQKIRYRLYPYQQEWTITDNQQKVSYNNLKANTYSFQIQNMYPNEQLGPLTELQITILPHWSKTWWFQLIILAIISILIFRTIHHFKTRQTRFKNFMELKHEVLAAQLERDKEKQLRIERENFFTNTAHELRTPLTLVLSPLQDIIQKLSSNDELHQKLDLIYRNGASLQTLIDQLLYIQKIEAGMVKLKLSETDIVSLLTETCNKFQELAASLNIQLKIEVPSHPYLLWIDAEKIISVFQNLISNSLKYTKRNGTINILVEPVEIDQTKFCCIKVADTGIGISEHLKEHIFDSFITGASDPQYSTQVGIGLHIVKHTVDLHHGKVTLDSLPGKGSTFTILLPEGNAHFQTDEYVCSTGKHPIKPTPKEVKVSEDLQAESSNHNKRTMLIIEDNADMRSFIKSIFQKDFNVIEATNGEEGVHLATEWIPSIIICDLMMPIKDGIACSREIRGNLKTAHIPILILTAKAEDTDVLIAIKTGVDDYVMKPFNPEILSSKAKNLITQRERLKRIYTKTLMLPPADSSSEKNPENNTFIKQIIHVIETNLSDETFNVKKLADELNMSQPTLYRKLKQVSKLNAIDMIRSIRMSKAATLILEQKYTMQEVAEMVGYNDTRTLRKHFTEQFGISPSQFTEKEKDTPMPQSVSDQPHAHQFR